MRRSTRASASSTTVPRPACFSARAQAAAVAPGGHHVVDQQNPQPGQRLRPRAGKRRPHSRAARALLSPACACVAASAAAARSSPECRARRAIACPTTPTGCIRAATVSASATAPPSPGRIALSRGSASASQAPSGCASLRMPSVFEKVDQLAQRAFVRAVTKGRVEAAQSVPAEHAAAFGIQREAVEERCPAIEAEELGAQRRGILQAVRANRHAREVAVAGAHRCGSRRGREGKKGRAKPCRKSEEKIRRAVQHACYSRRLTSR